MSENLKVNAKTQILEFKRKHNKIVDELPVNAQSGTISSALGLDSNGKLVKGTISGGTQLYKHNITGTASALVTTIISLSNSQATSFNDLASLVETAISTASSSGIVLKLFDDFVGEKYDALGITFTGPTGTLGSFGINLPHAAFNITDTVDPL